MSSIDQRKLDAEITNLISNAAKLQAETEKLQAESRKLTQESRWYLLFVGSALTVAIGAIVKVFL